MAVASPHFMASVPSSITNSTSSIRGGLALSHSTARDRDLPPAPTSMLTVVLCADTGLDLPDFRASERTFQLLAQVAGRAGRGGRAGRVIVQTYRPGASAVVAAAAHDYLMFFNAESASRADLHYPPHGRVIVVRVDGPDESLVAGVARKLAKVAEAVGTRRDRRDGRSARPRARPARAPPQPHALAGLVARHRPHRASPRRAHRRCDRGLEEGPGPARRRPDVGPVASLNSSPRTKPVRDTTPPLPLPRSSVPRTSRTRSTARHPGSR